MDVDSTPASAPVANGTATESNGTAPAAPSHPPAKKFTPPIDPTNQDLMPECTVYLRLLLILANLDAGKVQEVRDVKKRMNHRS